MRVDGARPGLPAERVGPHEPHARPAARVGRAGRRADLLRHRGVPEGHRGRRLQVRGVPGRTAGGTPLRGRNAPLLRIARGIAERTVVAVGSGPWIDDYSTLADASAYVSHASIASLSKAYHHGVPAVLLPRIVEQEFVAWRAEALGAAITINARQLDAGRLRGAVHRVVSEPSFRERAAWLGSVRFEPRDERCRRGGPGIPAKTRCLRRPGRRERSQSNSSASRSSFPAASLAESEGSSKGHSMPMSGSFQRRLRSLDRSQVVVHL